MLIGLTANGGADPKLPRWASILAHLDGKVNLKARENDKSYSLSLVPHSLSCIHEAPPARNPFQTLIYSQNEIAFEASPVARKLQIRSLRVS